MGAPDWVDVFPIENGDIPAGYVSLPEGSRNASDSLDVSQTPAIPSEVTGQKDLVLPTSSCWMLDPQKFWTLRNHRIYQKFNMEGPKMMVGKRYQIAGLNEVLCGDYVDYPLLN